MHSDTEPRPPWETNEAWRAAIALQSGTRNEVELATAAAEALDHMAPQDRMGCFAEDLPPASMVVRASRHQPTHLERQFGLVSAKIRTEIIGRQQLDQTVRVKVHLSEVEQAFIGYLLYTKGYAVDWEEAPATLDVDPDASDEAACKDLMISVWIPPSLWPGRG